MQKTFPMTYIHQDIYDLDIEESSNGEDFLNAIKNKKGIFAMVPLAPVRFRASGHCDIFDVTECKTNCYFQDALEISFWILN